MGTPALLTSLYVSLRGSGLKEASVGETLTSAFLWRPRRFWESFLSRCGVRSCAAYETVKAGQRSPCAGRHASLSSSFSEIEFGRARPTSLLHSTIHLLIPSGEERGRGNEVQEWEERGREGRGRKKGVKCKGGKWRKERNGQRKKDEEEGEKKERKAGKG